MVGVQSYAPVVKELNVTPLVQQFALVFSVFGGDALLSHHAIKGGKIGTGRPISLDAAQEAFSRFCEGVNHSEGAGQTLVSPWLDQDVIYSDANYLVYRTRKGTPKSMWFRMGGTSSHSMEVKVLMPTLVYVYSRLNGSLKIFASVTDFVTAETPLYVAPLPNTSSSGAFCYGSASKPANNASDEAIKVGIHEAVFDSFFTHLTGTNKGFVGCNSTEDFINMWKDLAKKKKVPTRRQLVKAGLTLSNVLKGAV